MENSLGFKSFLHSGGKLCEVETAVLCLPSDVLCSGSADSAQAGLIGVSLSPPGPTHGLHNTHTGFLTITRLVKQ